MNKAVIDESFVEDNALLLDTPMPLVYHILILIVFTTMGYNKLIAIPPDNISYAKTLLPSCSMGARLY